MSPPASPPSSNPTSAASSKRLFFTRLDSAGSSKLLLGMPVIPIPETDLHTKVTAARETLDAWTRQMIEWHFSPETGCPFWLDYAAGLGWDPRREIRSYQDLGRLGPFQDEWLRG